MARGSLSYLLLEVPGSPGGQTPGPDGGLFDPCLHSGALAAPIFPGEFLRDKHSLGAWRPPGHDIPDLGAQKGSLPPGYWLPGARSTHDNSSAHSSG